MSLVAKNKRFSLKNGDENKSRRQKKRFSLKNGDENEARRQKRAFLTEKWWREQISSPKTSISHLKMVTRTDLVAKIEAFSLQNSDENESRRQK